MIRKQVLGIIGVLMSVFLLASCVEDIDMDTGEDLPVVVDCVLKMDTLQTLRLYHMKPLNANGYEPVTEAKVELQRIQKNGSFFKVAEFQRSEGLGWNKVVVQKEKQPQILQQCFIISHLSNTSSGLV